jgi:choline dehydrogenase-like flavoprotein
MFDYAIVGAGTAGCALAGRLSEDPEVRVLLLEAGPSDRRLEVRAPAAFSRLFRGPRDWGFTTEPEQQLDGRRLYLPRGRMLGGSSSLNAMIYVRGHRADYDGWAASGAVGWSFAEVLPWFRKSEDQERGASEHHGVGGPLAVADPREPSPLSRDFVAAAVAVGMNANDDFNGAVQDGAGLYQVTQRRGRRWSAADAFLRPAARRANLTVATGARAVRLLWQGERAVGVEFVRHGRIQSVRVEREVLLAAGAFQSPQLLLLSGVGPASELERLGLPVVQDLPGVGADLQDHPVVGVAFAVAAPTELERAASGLALARWLLARRGPLTSNVAEAGGFVRTSASLPAPDIQFHFAPALFRDHALLAGASGFTIAPTLLTPTDRGRVSLATADPLAAPRIESRQLGSDLDLERLVDGIEWARAIAAEAPLTRRGRGELEPGPTVAGRAALARWVRRHAELLYHPVGTCRMGVDEEAVVDPELRVRGLEGVRVIDASVMPAIVRGNTNAPTLMIAERAAELLRAGR